MQIILIIVMANKNDRFLDDDTFYKPKLIAHNKILINC